jgi:hypothetical protein
MVLFCCCAAAARAGGERQHGVFRGEPPAALPRCQDHEQPAGPAAGLCHGAQHHAVQVGSLVGWVLCSSVGFGRLWVYFLCHCSVIGWHPGRVRCGWGIIMMAGKPAVQGLIILSRRHASSWLHSGLDAQQLSPRPPPPPTHPILRSRPRQETSACFSKPTLDGCAAALLAGAACCLQGDGCAALCGGWQVQSTTWLSCTATGALPAVLPSAG